ncbi:hypothetical protein C9890_0418 [Perkinsus sp. BL_2016]|nr:hypothetical protein C9890_0418 [Perkinsus sp. BL_2016]
MHNGFPLNLCIIFAVISGSSGSSWINVLVSSILDGWDSFDEHWDADNHASIMHDAHGDIFYFRCIDEHAVIPDNHIWVHSVMHLLLTFVRPEDKKRIDCILHFRDSQIDQTVDKISRGLEAAKGRISDIELLDITEKAIAAYEVEKELDEISRPGHINARLIDVCNIVRLLTLLGRNSHPAPTLIRKFENLIEIVKLNEYDGPIVF